MKFRVHSLRIEKNVTYSEGWEIYEHNEVYILNCTSDSDRKYEVTLWTENGDYLFGMYPETTGHGTVRLVDSFIGMTHKPVKDLEFELEISMETTEMDIPDMENEIFSLSYNDGEFYEPEGYVSINMDLFEAIGCGKKKRPVWIFRGGSVLMKRYIAGIIANSGRMKTVYDIDAHEGLRRIHEDMIVMGNKCLYSIDEIEKCIVGEHETILVDFCSFPEPAAEIPVGC